MRIVFMGTPEFALPSVEMLLKSEHKVVGVVTQPDKPKGRGKELLPTAVKEFSLKKNLLVLTPKDLNADELVAQLKRLNPDLIVVVAFSILPEKIFTLPSLGTVNLHASLLPKYRGAAPINWALINGEKKTGVTTFFIQKKVDTGNVILQEELDILPDENYGELSQRLSMIGAELLIKTLDLVQKGKAIPLPQDESLVTQAPKIAPEMCKIDWSGSAEQIKNFIRGLAPSPGAYTFFKGKILKVHKAEVLDQTPFEEGFGEIISADKQSGLIVKTKSGRLKLLEVQPESKKIMSGDEFSRGYRINVGDKLG